MAPRLSLPAMIRAWLIPGRGCGTTCMRKDSHLPEICARSIFPLRDNSSNTEFFPIVPTIITLAAVHLGSLISEGARQERLGLRLVWHGRRRHHSIELVVIKVRRHVAGGCLLLQKEIQIAQHD